MRRLLPVATLLTLLVAACSDNSSTTLPRMTLAGSGVAKSRATAIDNLIVQLFPKGLETATGARWDHVDVELGSWDAGAGKWTGAYADQGIKHTTDLVKFIQLKTGDIDQSAIGTETKASAASRLVAAMLAYVQGGPSASVPPPGADVTFAVVPAGSPATVITPSGHAGLQLPAGSTSEDRIIVVTQNNFVPPGPCAGPLNYTGCQFGLYYRFESLPHLRLNTPGRFVVCIDFTNFGPSEAQHQRLRLAHDLPADPADYTPGATQVEGIEILPLIGTREGDPPQSGFMNCDEPPPPPVIGLRGFGRRALYELARLGGKIFSPKELYAYDQGPEHDAVFFSNFNGVELPIQQPRGPVLYGVNAADDGLSTLDSGSVEHFIARLSPDQNQYTTPVAMAVDPVTDVIYVWNNSPKAELLTVDRCTGLAASVNPNAPDGGGGGSLAISPSTGVMYLLSNALNTVDKSTGVVTQVGTVGNVTFGGADFDDSGVLYAADLPGTKLYTVNTATGAATEVAALNPAVGTLGSIAFAPDGSLIGTAFGNGNIIFNIDKASGAVSNIRSITGGFPPQGLGFAAACNPDIIR